MNVKPVLTGYDALTLTLRVAAWDVENGIKRIALCDRHGLLVASEEGAVAPQAEVRVERLPRGRFPLFVELTDGKGAAVPTEKVGPIFPAPTDDGFKAGVALPRHAVDILNDPKIRSRVNELWRGERIGRELASRSNAALDRLRFLRHAVFPLVFVLAALSAACVAGAAGRNAWLAVAPAVAGLAVIVTLLVLHPRLRRAHAALDAVRKERAERLAARDKAVDELRNLRVLGRVLKQITGGAAECHCGDGKQEAQR